MAYIGKSPSGNGVRSRFYYTQTSGGGTSISGTDDNSKTLTFTDGEYIDVYLNGVLLVAGTDYNTNTANTISGLAALANGDVVEVVVYDIFTVADTVSASQGGTFQGNVVFNGTTTGLDLNGTELVLDADADTSITADTDDQIDFKTGGSDRMTIDSSGRISINETGTYNDANEFLLIKNTDGAANLSIVADNTQHSTLNLGDEDDFNVGRIRYQHSDNSMRLHTADTERMRIDSSGRLLINTTATVPTGATSKLQVQGDNGGSASFANTHSGAEVVSIWNAGTSGTRYLVWFATSSGYSNVGSITTTGTSTSYNTTSDHRLKEAVVDMTGAIARVKQLAPKRFNFIADPDDTTVDGFLAHEAQTVVPEAVTGTHNEVDDDGNAIMQGIDQSKLVPLLTGALQEAIAKIETLETKVAALEAAE